MSSAVPFTGNDMTYSTLIFIVLAIVFGVLLHATPFGRSIPMDANQEAALFADIRVKRVKTILFMISGPICSLAGVLWTFRLDTVAQNNGLGLELDVVAIVLLADVSIIGGTSSIIGVVTGALPLASVFLPIAGHRLRRWPSRGPTRRPSPGRAPLSADQPTVPTR